MSVPRRACSCTVWACFVLSSLGCQTSEQTQSRDVDSDHQIESLIDLEKAASVPIVLRVKIKRDGEGSLYLWPTVDVLEVLKNETDYRFGEELSFAHLSIGAGLPSEECTVYLHAYNAKDASLVLWKLKEHEEGSEELYPGFSHVNDAPDAHVKSED